MIDIRTERLLTLCQAARQLPSLRNNRPIHASTLWRWAKKGLRGVKLEVLPIGGGKATSMEALQRFFAALAQLQDAPVERTAPYQQDQIEQELIRAGL